MLLPDDFVGRGYIAIYSQIATRQLPEKKKKGTKKFFLFFFTFRILRLNAEKQEYERPDIVTHSS